MLIQKLVRLCGPLAIVMVFAVSCGGEATVDTGTRSGAAVADTSNDSASGSDQTEPTAVPAAEPTTAPEPTAVPATAVPEPTASADDSASVDEDDSGSSDDSGRVVIESRDQAIEFVTSEGFVASDAECIVDGAYAVFGTWDFVDSEATPAQDEALGDLLQTCVTVVPGPAAGSPPPGTDAELDALWVACDGGSASACDDLYFQSPIDSDYEIFGASCGGRVIASCTDVLGDDSGEGESGGVPGPAAGSAPPGTDAELDALWVACDGGSADACDELFWESDLDSDYEAFGRSCGGRALGSCSDILGDDTGETPNPVAGSAPPGTDAELDALWVACDSGSSVACDDLFWASRPNSAYEAFGLSCGGRGGGVCSEVIGDQ